MALLEVTNSGERRMNADEGRETETQPSLKSTEQTIVEQLRDEIDGYYIQLKTLTHLPPEEVFSVISAISARLTEIRGHLWRSESRRFAALRSREVDPLIEECDRQFKLHSRQQAVRQMDFELSKGF